MELQGRPNSHTKLFKAVIALKQLATLGAALSLYTKYAFKCGQYLAFLFRYHSPTELPSIQFTT